MAAGLTDHLWSMSDLAEMIDKAAPKAGKRGPYKKRMAALSTRIKNLGAVRIDNAGAPHPVYR
jgi:hypothetical protein